MKTKTVPVTCKQDIDNLKLVYLFNLLMQNKIPLELRSYAVSVYQSKSSSNLYTIEG